MPLNCVTKSLPLETAKFAVSRGIDDEPAFKWWVPYAICRRDRIIADVNKRIRIITHKNGVELQTSVVHAKKLDEKNGSTLWMDAINRQMENLKVAFDVLEDRAKVPVCCNKNLW